MEKPETVVTARSLWMAKWNKQRKRPHSRWAHKLDTHAPEMVSDTVSWKHLVLRVQQWNDLLQEQFPWVPITTGMCEKSWRQGKDHLEGLRNRGSCYIFWKGRKMPWIFPDFLSAMHLISLAFLTLAAEWNPLGILGNIYQSNVTDLDAAWVWVTIKALLEVCWWRTMTLTELCRRQGGRSQEAEPWESVPFRDIRSRSRRWHKEMGRNKEKYEKQTSKSGHIERGHISVFQAQSSSLSIVCCVFFPESSVRCSSALPTCPGSSCSLPLWKPGAPPVVCVIFAKLPGYL